MTDEDVEAISTEYPVSPPFRPTSMSTPQHESDPSSIEDSVRFCGRGINQYRRIWDTISDDETDQPNQSVMREIFDLPDRWREDPLWYLRYIDDGLAGEKIANNMGISHFTQHKENRLIHASGSERFLNLTIQNSKKIGMLINALKTKMVCVNASKTVNINTYINVGGEKIKAGEEMMMLGFKIGKRPDAAAHVSYIERRFYSKIWVVRHFKKVNTNNEDLLKIYTCYVLPVIEYATVVYHC